MNMRPGWNPGRRSRNVGTKAHGHGDDNRLAIPESWRSMRRFYEKLDSFVAVERQIGAHSLTFLVEPTQPRWIHAITVDDACAVLAHLPAEDLQAIDLIVMRQPTRKQRILSPVWGRAVFFVGVKEFSGNAIILEAQDSQPVRWSVYLSPERARELDRLAADGHQIQRDKRSYEIRPTATSLRNTVLYRTLLHEVGHHVDYRKFTHEEWDARTSMEKEDFAHRYAAEKLSLLRAAGVCPFPPIVDVEKMACDGLMASWFVELQMRPE